LGRKVIKEGNLSTPTLPGDLERNEQGEKRSGYIKRQKLALYPNTEIEKGRLKKKVGFWEAAQGERGKRAGFVEKENGRTEKKGEGEKSWPHCTKR